MGNVLVLRPEPAAEVTAMKLRGLGLSPVVRPLFEIKTVGWTAPDPAVFDGLLLTSANTVRCGGEQLRRYRGLKTYAVGQSTSEAARDAGFDVVATGEAGVDRLLASIEPDLRLLHLCGEPRREPAQARQKILSVPTYRSEEIENPDMSGAPQSIALIHSPRAGERFAQLIEDRGSITIAAISSAAAQAAGVGWRQVDVAASADGDALLALAARLCKNPLPE